MDSKVLTGLTSTHTIPLIENSLIRIHKDVKSPFLKLVESGRKDGFEIFVGSAFRDFEKQLLIWNEKCLGKRKLLDADGSPLDVKELSDEECVEAILQWSQLPGYSRHHWGTDLDVYDKKSCPPNYHVQFTPSEIVSGPFKKFEAWLKINLQKHDFYRPYSEDLGGVKPEWWHISYAPLAEKFRRELTLGQLKEVITSAKLEKKDVVLRKLPEIFERLGRVTPAPASKTR